MFNSNFNSNKTDRHDLTEILLKVGLNTINQTIVVFCWISLKCCMGVSHVKGVEKNFIFIVNDLWWEVIFRFADIAGIVDHHCLNFLFILLWYYLCYFQFVREINFNDKW
jgi:hypothetical protein